MCGSVKMSCIVKKWMCFMVGTVNIARGCEMHVMMGRDWGLWTVPDDCEM